MSGVKHTPVVAEDLNSPFNACCYRDGCKALLAENAALRGILDERDLEIAEDEALIRNLEAQNEDAETRATEAERKLADERLNYEGAMSDIDSLLKVLIRRINGEADLASAAEWVRLNYPIAAEAIVSKEAERG